jgi:hypothetical protein
MALHRSHPTQSIYDRVRAAFPVARQVLLDSIDYRTNETIDQFIWSRPVDLTDEQTRRVMDLLDRCYTLGVAVGALLSPHAFEPDPARLAARRPARSRRHARRPRRRKASRTANGR